jgi:hypothetical protein
MRVKVKVGSIRNASPVRALLGGVICLALSATGFYIALAGGRLESGIPFIPDALNQSIGRLVIGSGAVATGAMAVYAFCEAWKLRR